MWRRLIFISGLAIAGVVAGRSQTATWSPDAPNEVFNLGTGVNWVGGNVPAPDSNLIFGALNTGKTSTIRLLSSFSATSITFSGAYPAYTFSSNNGSQLSVGSGGITVGAGTNPIAFDSQLLIALAATQSWYAGSNLTVSGSVSGAFGITKNGSANLFLSGTNTYSGPTTFNLGVIVVSAEANLGAAPASATPGNLVFNGGTLKTTASLTLNANRGINLVDYTGGTIETDPSTTLTYGGVAAGSGSLTKSGDGTLVLSGANTFSGGFRLSAGELLLGASSTQTSYYDSELGRTFFSISSGPLGTGTLKLTGSGVTLGVTGTTTTLHNAIDLQFNELVVSVTGTNALALRGVVSGSGTLTKSGSGTLTLTANNTYTGGTTIVSGLLNIGDGGTTGSITANVVNNAALAFNRSDAATYSGVISGTGTLTKLGAGKLTLTGKSTYTGNTTVTGGILEILTANALPVTTLLSLASGTTLDVDANQTVAGFFGASGLGATIALANGVTFTVAVPVANVTTTFAGNVAGAGVFAVNGAGGDIVNLTGSVTNTGGTLVGPGASLVIASGGSVTGPITTSGTLSFGNPGTQILNNVISGTGGLSVSNGVTTLSGNNTYSGPTNITGGKLLLTGANTGGGTITVGNGAIFGGTGTTTGPLVLNSGSAVAPGASPGILSVGATTFAGGARFAFEINSVTGTAGTSWDLLGISGALTITATVGNPFIVDLTSLNLSNTAALVSNFNAANSYSWLFASASGGVTGFSAGVFQYNASAFQNNLNGGSFFVSNVGNDLFLNFTPVPEPSTYALLALGLGVIVVLSRRRCRRS